MRAEKRDGEVLERLATMPFLDRLEFAAVCGMSEGIGSQCPGQPEEAETHRLGQARLASNRVDPAVFPHQGRGAAACRKERGQP